MPTISFNLSSRIRLLALVCLLVSMTAHAETIRLKNGRAILADSAREVNGKVEYTIGENTYVISKASVESIDTGGAPIVTRRDDLAVPELRTEPKIGSEGDLAARVIVNGKVDVQVLGTIEQENDKDKSALANFIAAKHERANGSADLAEKHLRRARSFLPENDVLMVYHASVLIQLGRMADAASVAEIATRTAPTSASAFALFGYANLQLNKTKPAIKALKRSVELQPDSQVEGLLEKALREDKAEADFTQEDSVHFTLRYEGSKAPVELRRQILTTLEMHFNDLVRDLGFSPRESISVLLYTDQQFFDVTQAAAWIGALNDGKLRMPINGVNAVDAQFSRILKHELTHSFINQITRGRCPTWLNEGIAQLMEPRSAASEGKRLAVLYGTRSNFPLNQLEGSFVRFSSNEAVVAYAESLFAVEYIRDTYGMGNLATALKRIGEGQSTESALRSTIRSGYTQLEQELSTHLQKTYGG